MAAVLGVSCGYHDAAAALVVDGRIVAAMQEERFTRVKNDASVPENAVRAALACGGIGGRDLDRIVFYEDPYAKLERILLSVLRAFPRSARLFPRAMASQLGDRLWVLDALAALTGVDRRRVVFVSHHESHAASAFLPSPYARAAVLTVDGVGEDTTTAIWSGDGDQLTLRASLGFPHSLGLLWSALTAWLGFRVNEGEQQVMGLAAFGSPRFREEIARILPLGADGSFRLDATWLADLVDPDLGFGPRLEVLLGPRRPRRPWDLDDPADRRYADIAASLQAHTEAAMLALASEARRLTGADALCLAGGVALNAVANAKLAAVCPRLFVQPAAGDAGGALGAALLGARDLGDPRPAGMERALGTQADPGATRAIAQALGLVARRVDPAEAAAELVARGRLVGWVQGRFEWGPRALGHRSLLGDPRDAAVRDRLNAVVKRRAPFRPFAPSVLAGETSAYFAGGGPDELTPYMISVRAARPGLDAVTHVDGSARVQTVADGPLAPLLEALRGHIGAPVVLNTSLNGPGEPIVATERDALAFFTTHPIDALIVEDLLVERPP